MSGTGKEHESCNSSVAKTTVELTECAAAPLVPKGSEDRQPRQDVNVDYGRSGMSQALLIHINLLYQNSQNQLLFASIHAANLSSN